MKKSKIMLVIVTSFLLIGSIPQRLISQPIVSKEMYNECVDENNKCAKLLEDCNENEVKCVKMLKEKRCPPDWKGISIGSVAGFVGGILLMVFVLL